MPIFEAHFLVIEENIWFAPTEPYQAIQRSENGMMKSGLIIASDAEDAYSKAMAMTDSFSEANFDGPGDITNHFCKGICQLRELAVDEALDENGNGPQEIEFNRDQMDVQAAAIRSKEELDVFRPNGKTI